MSVQINRCLADMASNSAQIVLWIYIVLLFLGGLMGFIKAKSKPSLIMSAFFAAALALVALKFLPSYLAPTLAGVLLVFFGVRFARGKKFMPAGLMVILSLAALLALLLLR